MLDAKNIMLANGLSVDDYMQHFATFEQMARQNNLKFFNVTYGDVVVDDADGWFVPASGTIATNGNVADRNVFDLVDVEGAKALKLAPSYLFLVLTTFRASYITNNTKLGIQLASDYWVNGERAAEHYKTSLHVCEAETIGTVNKYTQPIYDIRTLTPGANIDGYAPSFHFTNFTEAVRLTAITQHVLAVSSNMR